MKLEFSRQDFRERIQTLNFTKISPVRAELFHADGQTDGHDEANESLVAI